jgi:hypothetical protein
VVIERVSEMEWVSETAYETARVLRAVYGDTPQTKSAMKTALEDKLGIKPTPAQERMTALQAAGKLVVVSKGGKDGNGDGKGGPGRGATFRIADPAYPLEAP